MRDFPAAVGRLDALLAEAVAANEPGIAAGVAYRGRPIWYGARGLANVAARIPFTTRTPFRVCSITKQFAAALVMHEARAGRLSLAAHPGTYLPWARGMDPALTVAHLLQNRSGLRDQWVLAMLMGAEATQPFTLADGIEAMRRAPHSMFAPGSRQLYCNGNFEIAGQILEAVTQRPFAALLEERILAPLGMRDSFLGIDTAQALPRDARGYRWHEGAWREEENALHWAASAGLVSSVEDLLKWAACLRDPRTCDMPWVADILRNDPFPDGAPAHYASGIGRRQSNGRTLVSHAGALRGWRSILMHFVEEDVSIAVFMNRTHSPQGRLPRSVADGIATALGIAPVWHTPGGLPRRAIVPGEAAGTYVSREQGVLVELRNGPTGAEAFCHLDWSPLFQTLEGPALATEDSRLALCWTGQPAGAPWLHLSDENLHAPMRRIAALRETVPSFAAHGRFRCAPLDSVLHIAADAGGLTIAFDGPFGRGPRHVLTVLDARTAWFDIARGVDESPPGRMLVCSDPAGRSVEVSGMLARRVTFRAMA